MDKDSGPIPIPQNDPSPGGSGRAPADQSSEAMQPYVEQAQSNDASAQLPVPQPAGAADAPQPFVPDGSQADDSGWQYGQTDDKTLPAHDLPPDVVWTAAEFVEHPKTASWYGGLLLAAVIVAALDFLFTRDFISVAVILFAAALFGVYAGHKPREQQYQLTAKGLQIGDKMYAYQTFKAFSVATEAGKINILFIPLARFAPPLTIYLSQDIEDQVVDYLSMFIPLEPRRNDAVDGLLKRIRF